MEGIRVQPRPRFPSRPGYYDNDKHGSWSLRTLGATPAGTRSSRASRLPGYNQYVRRRPGKETQMNLKRIHDR